MKTTHPRSPVFARSMATAVGELILECSEAGLRCIRWGCNSGPVPQGAPADHSILDAVERQIRAFFDSGLPLFEIPLDLAGFTPFQRRVFETLVEKVPPGETVSYGELAALAGRPGAAQAVGQVMASNRLSIIFPCHRVVASDGPGGFGPGLDCKRHLLELEGGSLQA